MARGWWGGVIALAMWGVLDAHAADDAAQRAVHLLAYIEVDYPAAVQAGAVVNAEEYAEMREFTTAVGELITALPAHPRRAELSAAAGQLAAAVQQRAPEAHIAAQASALKDAIIGAYAVVAAPRERPDLARGATLYQAQCAGCHGVQGRGDGPLAAGLAPAPGDFTDAARQRQQSLYGYYNTITLGVDGTAMRPFGELAEADRWALAFHVGGFLYDEALRETGGALWQAGEYRGRYPDLDALTRAVPAQLTDRRAEAVLAHLRAHPEALTGRGGPLEVARARLAQSLAQYRADERAAAYRSALSAYLDGFELVEQSLDASDHALRVRLEAQMLAYRAQLKAGAPLEAVAAAHAALAEGLDEAAARLQGAGLDPVLGFVSALVILLREGLEAVLVLAAIIAFLQRAGRADALRYVHYGWSSALLAGFATAAAAAWVVDVSGVARELSEGVSALVAAAVLFYMGYWLHDKAHAQRWQAYISGKLAGVLSGRTVWALVLVSFIAVYREMFETILFYQALWLQTAGGGHAYLAAGIGVGALALALAAWTLLRVSQRLPLGLFFGASALLMYLLAVVFAGKGVMALQEAGKLPLHAVAFPRIDLLGVYPSLQALAVQALLLLAAALHLWWLPRARAGAAAAPP